MEEIRPAFHTFKDPCLPFFAQFHARGTGFCHIATLVIELLCTDYNKKATSIHYYFGNAVLVIQTILKPPDTTRHLPRRTGLLQHFLKL